MVQAQFQLAVRLALALVVETNNDAEYAAGVDVKVISNFPTEGFEGSNEPVPMVVILPWYDLLINSGFNVT